MTRQFDRAAELEQLEREEAFAMQQQRSGLSGKTHLDSARECKECDEAIPEERRRAYPGVQTCADCQSIIEHKQRLYAR